MSDHDWELRGGGLAKNSSQPGMGVSLWQCAECGLAATRALTARNEHLNAVLPEPHIDAECDLDDA